MLPARDLELEASQALFAARALEAALHDPGPWTMEWGPYTVPAERVLTETGVAFRAVFPETCWIEPPDTGVVLRCRGEVMGLRRIDHPGDTQFIVTWELATVRLPVG